MKATLVYRTGRRREVNVPPPPPPSVTFGGDWPSQPLRVFELKEQGTEGPVYRERE